MITFSQSKCNVKTANRSVWSTDGEQTTSYTWRYEPILFDCYTWCFGILQRRHVSNITSRITNSPTVFSLANSTILAWLTICGATPPATSGFPSQRAVMWCIFDNFKTKLLDIFSVWLMVAFIHIRKITCVDMSRSVTQNWPWFR